MMGFHSKEVCSEHFNVVTQCRCPSNEKAIRYVECPGGTCTAPEKTTGEKIAEARSIAETYADSYNGSREHLEFKEIYNLLEGL